MAIEETEELMHELNLGEHGTVEDKEDQLIRHNRWIRCLRHLGMSHLIFFAGGEDTMSLLREVERGFERYMVLATFAEKGIYFLDC